MNPELIQTKFFTVHTLWIFIAIAIVAATFSIIKLGTKQGLKISFISNNAIWLIIASILGARIFALIINYRIYFYEFSLDTLTGTFQIWDKGLNLTGGIVGFFICLYYLCKKHEQDFFKWLDTLVPSFLIGIAFGHIGTFFEGSNYGNETSLPWGVNFESPSIKYTVPIHPTQIYAFLYTVLILIGLYLLNKFDKFKEIEKPGLTALLGASLYSFFKFLENFVRGDDTILILGIRINQIFALLATIFFGFIIYNRYNKRKSKSKKQS